MYVPMDIEESKMDDEYVYISVKLYLTGGQTEDSVQNIVSECDYSFDHESITDTEIVEILDTQLSGLQGQADNYSNELPFVDVYGLPEH